MKVVVALGHLLAELLSPECNEHRPRHVDKHEEEHGHGQREVVEVGGEDDDHQKTFDDGRKKP